ncbi:MAG TPA: WG repeat-containing protein [Chitinophagaceae bacterium]|jgi:hypothetical protein|nr:WG repeat-containing protein [Chitinophagaceae bacterium]
MQWYPRTFHLFLFFFFSAAPVFAQEPAPEVFYFIGANGKTGVRTAEGGVLIAAEYTLEDADTVQPIAGRLIYLEKKDTSGSRFDRSGYYFNRQGRFLFHPYRSELGPDPLEEGLLRFVEGEKIGFADRTGRKVIPARFDYAMPFEYGLSFFCAGCSFATDTSGERKLLVQSWGLLDKTGKTLRPPGVLKLPQYPLVTDTLVRKFPQPVYSRPEQALVARLRAVPGLEDKMTSTWVTPPDSVTYRIVERPTKTFPYYWIKAYGHSSGVIMTLEHFALPAEGPAIRRYWPAGDFVEELRQ